MTKGYRAIGRRHMVAAGHALAAEAANQILEAGGNAVDAGVAGGLALGVVQSDLVNVAGVAPLMVRTPDGKAQTIDGVGGWPVAATVELFEREHGGRIPQGILRTVLPAAPSAWIEALRLWGTMSFGEVAVPGIRLAREGFAMHWLMQSLIAKHEADYARWAANAAIYLPGGQVPQVGDLFVQADLAASIQHMADEEAATGGDRAAGLAAARAAFYEGDIAKAIVDYHLAEGGLLTREDLSSYRSKLGTPVTADFAGGQVLCSGAYCQGPFLGLTLELLDRCDWQGVAPGSSMAFHRVAEAVKLSFADREAILGDPDFVDVPLEHMFSDAYLAERFAMMDDAKAWPDMPPSGLGAHTLDPIREKAPAPGDTSYISVMDASGLAFSATPSDVSYTAPVIPGTGLVPSSRGSASWGVRDHPSAVAPGKRPRLTPNPAIWVGADGTVMPFGTPGGDVQIQAMVQVLLNRVVFGMEPQAAVEAPRVASYSFPSSFAPHESHPGLLRVESRVPEAIRAELTALGHRVEAWPDWTYLAGAVCAVEKHPDGVLEGAADPRRPCGTAGR